MSRATSTRTRPARPARLLGGLAATGVLLLAGCADSEPGADQDAAELQRFEADGFSIDLPGEPTTDTQTVPTAAGDLEVTLHSVESDDAVVAVALTALPGGTPVDLDGAVAGAASNVGGEVVESETGEFDGYETRDATISVVQSGQEGTGFLRVIDVDGKLLQVQQIVAGADVAEPPASYDEIVDSVEIS